jgi:hypothetical protein
MGRSTDKETGSSEQGKYRSWTAQQTLEIVLAGMRGDRAPSCRSCSILNRDVTSRLDTAPLLRSDSCT